MYSLGALLTRRHVATLTIVVTGIVLLMAGRPAPSTANQLTNAYFVCAPQQVGTFEQRVHVRCVPSAPNSIAYFAVCTTNAGFAARALSVFTTAKVTGKGLAIYYDPNDLSGSACGCSTADCRVISGTEVMP